MQNIISFNQLLEVAKQQNKRIYEVFQELESYMMEKPIKTVREQALRNLKVMNSSIEDGLKNFGISPSGMSGEDAQKILKRYKNDDNLPFGKLIGKIMAYSVAISEENQRMGRIVACPTAGSCGIVPSVIIGYATEYGFDRDRQIDALITAGGIGKIIAEQIHLAGAVGGCQAECGVASAMAAGAAVDLLQGNNEQIIHAASLALKNIMGLVCDPVAGLVEVPCIKRNGFLAVHAVTASEMSLAGVQSFIPPDEVVQAVKQAGVLMSPMLKESSEAGLAVTKTAKKLQKSFESGFTQ